MAVIQDLPLELLRRTLELLADDWRFSTKRLMSASLVARGWRRPSQDLLICTVPFDISDTPSYGRIPRPSISPRTLDWADLDCNSAQKGLELLTEAEATVRTLRIVGTKANELDFGTMRFEMLAGLHTLDIDGDFQGQPSIPSDATIELKSLSLDFIYLPPPAFLASLVRAAPFLTRLELYAGAPKQFPEGYSTALQTLAPQLRHLGIHADATSTPTRPRTLDLHGFVASCTSLRSLELDCATPASIKATLTAMRSPLVLLATELDWKWRRRAEERGVAELVDVLKHP